MAGFTHKNVKEVHDSAPDFGFGEHGEMRFAAGDVDAERTGFTYQRLNPDVHSPVGHRHEEAEEVYFVISGSGRMRLDDVVIEIGALDSIRVAPGVWRGFAAGPDGLEVLAFGARHEGDGELDMEWWTE